MLSKSVLAVVALALSPANALWPVPKTLSTGNSTLWIDQTVSVTYNGESLSYASSYSPPPGSDFSSIDIVQGGVSRALGAIFEHGLTPWMLRGRDAHYEPTPGLNGTRISSLEIVQTEEDSESTFKPLAGEVDESYTLDVTIGGKATLEAVSSTGVLRGLETFAQLFYKHSDGQHYYTTRAPVAIDDEPKYPHRGLLLDVARHWFTLDDIKRTIDGLAMNKMNVLHLHITDTQSWPLEVPALPELSKKGAYAAELTYSPEAVAELHQYAVHRGVQLILEIDMPGHVGIEAAYPGLTVAFNEKPYQWYCAQPPCGSFKLNDSAVEEFLSTLFDDLLPRVSPYTAYFHTGGDEYKANNSLLDPALETNDLAVLQPMLQSFLEHVHGKVREHGLVPFVWEEMVLEWNATLGEDTVIQSWLGNGAVKELAEGGHKVIDSNYNIYYLDCGRGQWLDFPNGETIQAMYPFNDWCNPTKNWRLIYAYEPRDGVADDAKDNVLGGEVALWTETVDPVSLDTLLWPRAGAAAEVWWSGRVDADGVNRTETDARPRLSEQRERMLLRGVRGTPITQQWCDMSDVGDCTHTN
jgi:hexosaminidase